MFLGLISGYTTAENTPIPFTTEINSNAKISNNGGVISLNKSGYYNIDLSLNVTGIANTVGVIEYADSVARISSDVSLEAVTDIDGIVISDAVKVTIAPNGQVATLKFVPTVAGATISGKIRIEYVQ